MTDQLEYISNFLDYVERTRNLQYGVLLRSVFSGKTFAHMEDTANFTESQAIDEAMHHNRNDLLGIFSVNMASGEIKQVMNQSELIDACEERERQDMIDIHGAEWLARAEKADNEYKSR